MPAVVGRSPGRDHACRRLSGAAHVLGGQWGHPEELLAAALCAGAAIAAVRGRALAGGVLLGLALATKEWAWLALLPVVLTMGQARVRMLIAAGGTAAAYLGLSLFAPDRLWVRPRLASRCSRPQATDRHHMSEPV